MKRLALALVVLVALAPLLAAAPAQSATTSSSGPEYRARIFFDKNWSSPSDSRVIWRLYQHVGRYWRAVETVRWRAGSGMLGRDGTNSCIRNHGWLPNGVYGMRLYADYPGSVIHGRAFRLDDKKCANGTQRSDLFLHTEQGPRNTQCRDAAGDQSCRWEFPRINDYMSLGCIKLAPRDLARLAYLYHRHFAYGVRYTTWRVSLWVIS